MHVCLSLFITGLPWWPCTLQQGGGVIKDQGQRPFPFLWEDEWPCLKVAAFGFGAIRVCCEPATLTALCTKAGPWETEKYSAFCWNQRSTVMWNKLNAFSFSFSFLVFSWWFFFFSSFPLLHKPGEKRKMCWLQESAKKGPPRVLFRNINIWFRKSFSTSLWPYKLTRDLISW